MRTTSLSRLMIACSSVALAVSTTPAAAQSTVAGGVDSVVTNGAGSTVFQTSGNTSNIVLGNSRTIINWTDFSVPGAATVNFVFGANNHAVLNRVVGGNFSVIDGQLNSYIGAVGGTTGGQVYLINSNGLLFGSGARIDVGGFVASTRDLADLDFLDGDSSFNFSGIGSSIVGANSGATIRARSGPVVIIADSIFTGATISATGDVAAIAASNVVLTNSPGSPLAMAIAAPASDGSIDLGGVVTGRSIYAASLPASSVTNALLNVTGSITATGASVTDRGIVLTTGGNAPGVDYVQGNTPVGTGNVRIDATLSSASAVTISSSGKVDASTAISGTSVDVAATGNVNVTNVSSSAGDVDLFTSGSIVAGNVAATGGNARLIAGTGVTTNAVAASQLIEARSFGGGTLSLGQLNGATGRLETSGAVAFTNATVGDLRIGTTSPVSSLGVSGIITAQNLQVSTTGALNLSAAHAIAATSGLDAAGVALNSTTALAINGAVGRAGQDVTLTAGGPLTINAGGSVIGNTVVLSTAGNFINNRGSNAITAGNRWLVYSSSPTGNVFGGLNSGNTAIWNATLATRAPGTISGNRYVFVFQPTVTVSSTNATKVYSTDLTGALGGNFVVTGLQPGVAGAYLGDTQASILSGAPVITSTGSAANADVAGSPYVIDIAAGSLTASNGYALALDSAGRLTITPKAIAAGVTADSKTYDGTTTGTGSVTLSGVIAGDSVGTSGTTFTFADKNAGTGKTVTVTGTTLTGADAGNYTLTVPASAVADILARAIGATVTANGKTYDGTTTGTGSVTLSGVIAGDSVGTSGTTFTFADKNAGTGKTVTVTGTTLTGADAGNYTLTVPASAVADILARAIGATVTANGKTYDGTTTGTGSVTLSGVIAGDSVGTRGTTFTFADKNAGTGKTVTVTGTTLTGADAGNYTLTVPASAVADILARAIGATVTANGKTYDGTTTGTGSVTLSGVIAGDSVGTSGTTFTFADKNAGTGKTVTVTGTTLTGADAGNYTLTVPASAVADILARAIGATVTANGKTYDGTTTGTGSVTLSGVIAGDSVGTSGTTFTFADKNAGTGKTVTVTGTTLTGADAGNYTLTVPASAVADILARAIGATVTANGKTYDGTTTGTGSVTLSGVIAGDSVGTSGTTFTFADKNAGTGKTVTVTGTTLTGADAGNYTLTVPASAVADILARALAIAAVDAGKTVGTIDPLLTYVIGGQGLVAGDILTGGLVRTPGESAGTYAIGQGTLSAGSNYAVTYTPGVFTIAQDASPPPVENGFDPLKALPLPDQLPTTVGGIVYLAVDSLCPQQDKACTARKSLPTK